VVPTRVGGNDGGSRGRPCPPLPRRVGARPLSGRHSAAATAAVNVHRAPQWWQPGPEESLDPPDCRAQPPGSDTAWLAERGSINPPTVPSLSLSLHHLFSHNAEAFDLMTSDTSMVSRTTSTLVPKTRSTVDTLVGRNACQGRAHVSVGRGINPSRWLQGPPARYEKNRGSI